MADEIDYNALFDPDSNNAINQAQQLARAIRQRRAMAALGMVTGDPAMGSVGKEFAGEADSLDKGLLGAAQHRSQLDVERKRWGPSQALGGLSVEEHEAITKRKALAQTMLRMMPTPYGPVPMYQQGGGAQPAQPPSGGQQGPGAPAPMPVDFHTMREREKRKAGLYIGPDIEPSDELLSAVQGGMADPRSPGMRQAIEHVAELNRNAAGFSDIAQQARDMLEKHPDGSFAGTDATRMHSIFTDMRSLYMANLNMKALREFDVPILNAALNDPTQLQTILKSKTGILDLKAQLDQAQNLAKQRALSEAAAVGYRPSANGRYANFRQTTEAGSGGGKTVVETRQTRDGRTLVKYSDGTIGEK